MKTLLSMEVMVIVRLASVGTPAQRARHAEEVTWMFIPGHITVSQISIQHASLMTHYLRSIILHHVNYTASPHNSG